MNPTTSRFGRTTDLWTRTHAERQALADDLADLTEAQWATTSLCTEFSVREVLAHLTSAAGLNAVRWLAGVLRCRFDFDKQVAMRLREQLGSSGAETLAGFRGIVTSTVKPPLPVVAVLGETVVHGEDIRRPLGISRDHPIETLTLLARYYSNSNMMLPAKKHTRGLRLAADDGPFATGSGPRVSGSTSALIMAMAGRSAYFGELDGDGVAILSDRYRTG